MARVVGRMGIDLVRSTRQLRPRGPHEREVQDRVSSCEDWIILTSLFSLVGGRSTEAVVSGVLHIGADVVVPQTVSVCKCSFSSPMRLRDLARAYRQRTVPWADKRGAVRSASDRRARIRPNWRVAGRDIWYPKTIVFGFLE
uniref:Uncharacterized protein n=1 Tax=Ananas comosus var. bracteatus TaxID=296719 RepID=A0A6V7PHH2_ANACO|nr:unnamed protein product [Ananas comosus var. bracteatus]